ncbi:MAG: acyl-CoA dehydratase activase [Spirochaetia bacterium]|nr:acyl-CoA dehydratase activase [Spirochaetia bacterium]
MKVYAGIDIGSTSIKIVLIDESENIVAHSTNPTGASFHKNSMDAFQSLLERENIQKADILYLASTGYGRKLLKEADETISEITANAVGAKKSAEKIGTVKTVINIGGQDLKGISLDEEGNCGNFVMNDKCAAGTGRFLEMTARTLETSVDKLGELHFNLKGVPASINSTCTVFAESEIISLLANGHSHEGIVVGVHYSIAKRIARLIKRIGVEDIIFFDGGPAMNKGLVEAVENELMRELYIPDVPQITTAFGAALIARSVYHEEEVHA